ncbi:MAG: hypothetical protein VX130_03870 [Verrucomicrobiota bacterium]|nr:hypothetical protein [Verrucomicrobiota bacterium]
MSTAAATAPPKIRKSRIRKKILGLAFLGGPLGGMAFWGVLGPFGAPGGGPEGGGGLEVAPRFGGGRPGPLPGGGRAPPPKGGAEAEAGIAVGAAPIAGAAPSELAVPAGAGAGFGAKGGTGGAGVEAVGNGVGAAGTGLGTAGTGAGVAGAEAEPGLGGVGGKGAEGDEGGVPVKSAGLGVGDGACASTFGAKGLRVTLNFGAPPGFTGSPSLGVSLRVGLGGVELSSLMVKRI